MLRRLLRLGASQPLLGSSRRDSSKASSVSVRETLEELGVTYHEHLIRDQAKISSIIKEKQASFAQNPYSSKHLTDYVKVLTIFGYEKEAVEVMRNLQLSQYMTLTMSETDYHPRKKYSLLESYFDLQAKLLSALVRLGIFGMLAVIIITEINWFRSGSGDNGDPTTDMFSRFLVGEIPKPTAKPNIHFSDIIVAAGDQGIDEYRAEVEELVDFLKDPEKYISAGAKMPKGILFHGTRG